MISLFILGPPGAGKTWLVRQLLACDGDLVLHPQPKWTAGESIVAAGHYTDAVFSGADTVPYTGARAALEHWAAAYLRTHELTIFDGARFSTAPSLEYVAARSRVIGVHLDVPEETLARQRAARGSNQNPSWMRGAATGARNFAARIGAAHVQPETAVERTLALIADALAKPAEGRETDPN